METDVEMTTSLVAVAETVNIYGQWKLKAVKGEKYHVRRCKT